MHVWRLESRGGEATPQLARAREELLEPDEVAQGQVDGQAVATGKQANSIAFQQVADETLDIGVDTRTGVNDKDYQSPFPFKGTINKLTIKLGPSQLAAEDQKAKAEAIARVND